MTAADVAQRIERAYGEQLDSKLRRWYDGLVRTLNPTVNAAPGGGGLTAQPQLSAPGLLDRLALPRRIHERTGRLCVIAFDEFQEVVRIDAALPGSSARSGEIAVLWESCTSLERRALKVIAERTGWRLVDPFLASWLRES